MNDEPVYRSECSLKNFWSHYEIFHDRVMLNSAFGKFEIPFENIESFSLAPSDVKGLLKGNLQLKDFRPALKLDFANFMEHIVIDKSDGKVHRILFTPGNPDEFFEALQAAYDSYRK